MHANDICRCSVFSLRCSAFSHSALIILWMHKLLCANSCKNYSMLQRPVQNRQQMTGHISCINKSVKVFQVHYSKCYQVCGRKLPSHKHIRWAWVTTDIKEWECTVQEEGSLQRQYRQNDSRGRTVTSEGHKGKMKLYEVRGADILFSVCDLVATSYRFILTRKSAMFVADCLSPLVQGFQVWGWTDFTFHMNALLFFRHTEMRWQVVRQREGKRSGEGRSPYLFSFCRFCVGTTPLLFLVCQGVGLCVWVWVWRGSLHIQEALMNFTTSH